MGAWGPGLFQDDTACDVRDEFLDLIGDGQSTEEATAALEGRWGTPQFDPDDASVFWIALAATQARYGRLLPHVKDRAVAIIDAGADLERFFDEGRLRENRAAVLLKLREQLLGPQRKPRAVRKDPVHATPHPVGAILAYRLRSGRSALWRVLRHKTDQGGRYAVVEVLPGLHEQVPSELQLAFMPGLRLSDGRYFEMTLMPWHEASDRLAPTGRGGSLLSTVMRRLRTDPHALAGRYLSIIPVNRGLDEQLSDHFGMT